MVKITINKFKPVSINSMYYRNRKLTENARKSRSIILTQLQSYLDGIETLSSDFNPLKHGFKVSYTFYIPEDIYFTKKGAISNRSQDLDNCLKLLTDCLFNPKYDTTWLKSRTRRYKPLYNGITTLHNVGIDDRFISSLSAKKLPTQGDYRVDIEIGLEPLSEAN
jgi:hypothetical protein